MAEALAGVADLLAVAVPTFGWAEGRRLLASAGSAAEINRYLERRPEHAAEDLMVVLRYFDPVNFAGQVVCPTLVGVGMVDEVVPAPTVLAIADRLGGPTRSCASRSATPTPPRRVAGGGSSGAGWTGPHRGPGGLRALISRPSRPGRPPPAPTLEPGPDLVVDEVEQRPVVARVGHEVREPERLVDNGGGGGRGQLLVEVGHRCTGTSSGSGRTWAASRKAPGRNRSGDRSVKVEAPPGR